MWILLVGALALYGQATTLTLETALVLWLLATLPTQVLIYRVVETRLGLFWKSVLSDGTLAFAVVSVAVFLSVVWLSQNGTMLLGPLGLTAAFCLSGAALIGPRLVDLKWSKLP